MADEIVAKYRVDVDNASRNITELSKRVVELEAKLEKAGTKGSASVNNIGKSVQGLGSKFANLGSTIAGAFGITVGIAGFVSVIRGAIRITADFEAQMSKVKAVSGANSEEMEKLTNSAKALGASTKFTATEVGQLQEEFGKLGFTTQEILAATNGTLDLAAAAGTTLSEAASVAGSTIRGFGLDASEAGRVADVMALAFSKSALDIEDFRESMKLVAPIAAAANIDLETTTALLGRLSDVGLKGSIAGTGLKNLLSKLSDSSSVLSKDLGFTVKNSNDLFRAFKQLESGNIDLTAATELTDERSKAAFLSLIKGIDNVQGLKTALDGASGSAKVMAETMENNLSGSITKLSSAYEGLILQIMQGNGLMKSFVDGLATATNRTTEAMAITENSAFRWLDVALMLIFYNKELSQASKEAAENAVEQAKEVAKLNSEIKKALGGSSSESNNQLREQIKNVFYYTEAISALDKKIKEEGTAVSDILPLIKKRTELGEKLKEVIGEETEAMKAKRIAEEELLKIEKKRAEEYNKAQEAEAARLLKQEEDNAKERVKIAEDMAKMLIEIERYLATTSEEIRDVDLADNQRRYEKDLEDVMKAASEHVLQGEELSNQLQAIKAAKDKADEKSQQDHNDRIFDINKDLADRNADLDEEELKKEEEKKEREMRLFEAIANTTVQLIGMVSQAQQESYQRDLDNLQERLDQGLISEEEYDKEKRNLLRKQNEAAKQAAIFTAIINTAVAVTAAAGVPVIGFALAILAGILGAAQIALITSQQPPQFAKGVVDLQGEGTATSDSIHAKLSKGESVITAKETSKHRGLLEAMNKGLAEKYILSNYVKPALDSAMLSGFADMGKSAEVNGLTANLKDHNIIAAMDRHRAADVAGFKMLAAKLDRRQPKRGGYA
jgi:TP901 family phage tail tape measure protein